MTSFRQAISTLFLAGLCCAVSSAHAQNYGYQSTAPDPSRYDSSHPVMDSLSRAGVIGGVQNVGHVKAWLSPGDNIQAAINNGGPGVVHLAPGTYVLNDRLVMRDGVVLRGAHRDNSVLSFHNTATYSSKKFAVNFWEDTSYAGIENLTISYDADWRDSNDQSFENNPFGRTDLYVGGVAIFGSNNWVQSVNIRDAGTDPIRIDGNHNTIRQTSVDGAFNKGGNGNGYLDIRGDQNLIVWSNIRNIRHVAIQQGARHNVLFDNYISGDVNFHNGDGGQNLVERNTIYKPSWHPWQLFGTGGAQYGHAPPGSGNLIFKNDTWSQAAGNAPWSHSGTTFTFTGYGSPQPSGWDYPDHHTYYSIKQISWPWSAGHIGKGDRPGFISQSGSSWRVEAAGADIWGQEDDFYYTWQGLHGDGQIIARIASQGDTNDWAKAGLMFRESLESDSKHGMVALTPDNGIRFQYRQWTHSHSSDQGLGNFDRDETWLALTRSGNTIIGYVWADDRWIIVGSANISMWAQAYVGFFATSHDQWQYSTVDFDNIGLSSSVTITPPTIGDLDLDGTVNEQDLALLLANWGTSVSPYAYGEGDWTGDGLVGQDDLNIVLANWSSGTPPNPNIPEPGTAAALLGMILLCQGRWRRKRLGHTWQ